MFWGGNKKLALKNFQEGINHNRKCWSKDYFFCDYDETEIRLLFYKSISTFWNIFGGICTHFFYLWAWVRGDVKSVELSN